MAINSLELFALKIGNRLGALYVRDRDEGTLWASIAWTSLAQEARPFVDEFLVKPKLTFTITL